MLAANPFCLFVRHILLAIVQGISVGLPVEAREKCAPFASLTGCLVAGFFADTLQVLFSSTTTRDKEVGEHFFQFE